MRVSWCNGCVEQYDLVLVPPSRKLGLLGVYRLTLSTSFRERRGGERERELWNIRLDSLGPGKVLGGFLLSGFGLHGMRVFGRVW